MERKRNQVAEVNWFEYFKSIQKVCPWSLPAYKKNLIDITQYRGYRIILERPLLARVYICNLNARRLKKLCGEYDQIDKENEWLWSHPKYQNHSAPVACLIQQNRLHLEEMRMKYAKYSQAQ